MIDHVTLKLSDMIDHVTLKLNDMIDNVTVISNFRQSFHRLNTTCWGGEEIGIVSGTLRL